MTEQFPDTHDDMVRSILYFLQHEEYICRSVTGTFVVHFRDDQRNPNDVVIAYGFPDEPVENVPPGIYLGPLPHEAPGMMTYGDEGQISESFVCRVVGFSGHETESTDLKSNLLLRDRMMNDLYYLINGPEGAGRTIAFYEFDDDDAPNTDDASSVRIERASTRPVDMFGEGDAHRYAFVCTFTATVLTQR